MKVVYIANSQIPSQSANSIQVVKMCEAIAKLGHEVSLFIRNKKEDYRDDIFRFYGLENIFEIKRTPFKGKPLHAMLSLIYTKLKTAELCYTRSAYASYLTSRLGIPTILEVHRPFSSRFGKLIAPSLLNSHYLKIVSISNSLTEFYIEHYGIKSREKIITKHDGVDLNMFPSILKKEEARRKLNLPQDKRIICYCGHLYRGRGIEFLLSISGKLSDNLLILIVGGTNRDLERCKNIAFQMNSTNVYFAGFVPISIVPEYLSASDVLIIPYTNRVEDNTGCIISDFMSPLKMFEYMASGRPIVASNLGVIREILKDKETALLFKPEDEKDFIDAIKSALEDKELAQRIARNAQDEAKKYTWSERAKSILSFSSEL